MPMTVGCNEVLGITVGAFLAQARAAAPACKRLVFSPPQPPTLNDGSAVPCGGSDKLTFQLRFDNSGCDREAPRCKPSADDHQCTPPRAALLHEPRHEDARSYAHW